MGIQRNREDGLQPQPREVLAHLRQLNCPIIMGNTDKWLLNPKPHPVRDEDSHKVTAVEMWAAEQLTTADKTFIINPGSVGLPWEYKAGSTEIRNPPWAEYAIIRVEDSQPEIIFHRIQYDVTPLIEVARQCGMPYTDWWTQDW